VPPRWQVGKAETPKELPTDINLKIQQKEDIMFINTTIANQIQKELISNTRKQCTQFHADAELIESQDSWILLLDLPGMDREDVEILVENDFLVVKGSRNRQALDSKDKKERLVHSSRHFGQFERRYRLSKEIDYSKISAHMDKGVLRIELSKAAKAIPKKVEISIH
jgi:HSP20 family molecular chaperone IbpA